MGDQLTFRDLDLRARGLKCGGNDYRVQMGAVE